FVSQLDLLDHLVNAPSQRGAMQSVKLTVHGQRLVHSQIVVEVRLFRQEADRGAVGDRQWSAAESHLAPGPPQQAEHGREGRRRPGAVRTNEAEDLAVRYGEIEAVERDELPHRPVVTKVFGERIQLEDRSHLGHRRRAPPRYGDTETVCAQAVSVSRVLS